MRLDLAIVGAGERRAHTSLRLSVFFHALRLLYDGVLPPVGGDPRPQPPSAGLPYQGVTFLILPLAASTAHLRVCLVPPAGVRAACSPHTHSACV